MRYGIKEAYLFQYFGQFLALGSRQKSHRTDRVPLRTTKHEFDLRYGNYTKPTGESGDFRKPQIKVLTTLFATMLIVCGKVNFTNLSRYSSLSEKTYRRQFNKPFNFGKLNAEVIKAAIPPS